MKKFLATLMTASLLTAAIAASFAAPGDKDKKSQQTAKSTAKVAKTAGKSAAAKAHGKMASAKGHGKVAKTAGKEGHGKMAAAKGHGKMDATTSAKKK
jgi:hypothetical protein